MDSGSSTAQTWHREQSNERNDEREVKNGSGTEKGSV